MTTRHSDLGSTRAPTALVLGGSGFIGRHTVVALRARGCRVVVGSRHPAPHEERPVEASASDWRCLNFASLLASTDWVDLLDGVDVAVNCVGILRPRGCETYDRVHHLAPAALAAACRERKCRLIHVSALGLHADMRSAFSRSKLAGEAALRTSGADWTIVRPSLLDGEGGYGAKWLRRVARWPLHAVPADAAGRIAVLDVRDLGEALAELALRTHTGARDQRQREIEIGGGEARTLAEHLLALRRLHTARGVWRLRIPAALARLASHVCDLLHVTPFSFGHWELLRRDNCPAENHLAALLAHAPRPVGLDEVRAARRWAMSPKSCDGR